MSFAVLSSVAGILMMLASFIYFTNETWVNSFVDWLGFGFLYTFVVSNYYVLVPFLIVLFALKWIRDWRILLVIFGFVFFFLFTVM